MPDLFILLSSNNARYGITFTWPLGLTTNSKITIADSEESGTKQHSAATLSPHTQIVTLLYTQEL